jgi:hypothetical protein
MNRAIARQSSPIVASLEQACHAGGRGFESRRSRLSKCLQMNILRCLLRREQHDFRQQTGSTPAGVGRVVMESKSLQSSLFVLTNRTTGPVPSEQLRLRRQRMTSGQVSAHGDLQTLRLGGRMGLSR